MLIFNEASKHGLTPKLFGVFNGGRIEEFIESRHLNVNDLKDPVMRREIAITLARYHSLMDMPFAKPSYSFADVLKDIYRDFVPVKESYLNHSLFVKANIDPSKMGNYDFKQDLDWVTSLLDWKNHRMVFMHWDTQFMNLLVPLQPKPHQRKVMLIDLENTSYNIRGKDIGLLFSQFLLSNFKQGSFPDEDYCKEFLLEYQQETQKLGYIEDFDPKGKDSLDHLYFESLIGTLVSALCFNLFLMRYHERFFSFSGSWAELNFNEFQWYLDARELFIKRFPDFAPNKKL